MSIAQQRLWFMEQLEPGNPFYNIPFSYLLAGPLDVAALEAALGDVLERHEVLRSSFVARDGRPVLRLRAATPVRLPVDDVDAAPDEHESRARQLAAEEVARPFDLTTDLLLRTRLLRLGPEKHVLLGAVHHIVADGWSMRLFGALLGACYSARLGGREPQLPQLPLRYVDYAAWQRARLQRTLGDELRHWRERLTGAPPVLQLPTDRPRPAVQSFRGAAVHFEVPAEVVAELAARGGQLGATLFMTTLAAFKVLLRRYTGVTDVVVGTPVAGRTHLELEGLIGLFVNTLVLRTDVSGDPTFRQVLDRVCETAIDAYTHQEVPFDRLVEELVVERDLTRNPLVQVMFQLVQLPAGASVGSTESGESGAEPPWRGLEVTRLGTPTTTTRFDMEVLLNKEPEGRLDGWMTYSTDLFDEATARRWVGHYLRLLKAVGRDMGRPVSELQLLTDAERHQLLVEWKHEPAGGVPTATLDKLFEAQVARSPLAVAVVFEEQRLTYAELNARANQLARALSRVGVGPGSIVGIFLEPSVELAVSVLAVWKAGCAYLPLDPEHPDERLRFVLTDTGAAAVVTASSLAVRLGGYAGEVVSLDEQATPLAGEEATDPALPTDPAALAYVMFTSGSTGRPKGVMVEHRNLVPLFATVGRDLGLGDEDVWTLFHSFGFDFSVWEMWGALLFGGRLVIVPRSVSRSPQDYWRLVVSEGVTVLNQTPSGFMSISRLARASTDIGDEPPLRLVLLGGEPLEVAKLETWMRKTGDRGPMLVNMYGVTEAAVIATYHRLTSADLTADAGNPIGRPLAHLNVLVLDEHLNLAPVGIPGELHVSEPAVARGYLGRPGLTAERFIPNPYEAAAGERLYKTGDLARWRPDGSLEYLGRIDQQVKIRGFRIEAGEVEAALVQHPRVHEVAVVAPPGQDGEPRLVAYLICAPGVRPPVEELRAFLGERLPAFMIPSLFVWLESLPLTPNGKVDRPALPRPDPDRPELVTGLVAPRNPVEERLVDVWSEALGVTPVGIDDNFFDLGGSSLLAIQLVARLRQEGLPCTLKDLMQSQTIRSLANRLSRDHSPGGGR